MLAKHHSPQSLLNLAVHYFPDTSAVKSPCPGCDNNTCGLQFKAEHAKQLEERFLSKYKIFGDPSEIRQELHAFENFPGSYKFFSKDLCDGLSATPIAYHSEDGEMCLYGQDILICLQEMVLCEVPTMNHPLLRAMLSTSLKLYGGQLKTCSFISTADNLLGHIHSEFMKKFREQRLNCSAHHLPSTPAERFSRFLKMLPVEDASHGDFKTLKLIFEDLKEKEGQNFDVVIANLECTCKKVMEGLKHVVHSWRFHIPNEEQPIAIRPCPTVRCFVDGPARFSLKEELEAAGDEPYVYIITPISRTKFRAVPILMPGGNYCILATDMLFRVIFDMTFGMNVFAREDCWEAVIAFVKSIETTFRADQEAKHFEDVRTVRALVKFTWVQFADFINPAIEDYSSLDLKTELSYLQLDKSFAHIMEYADQLQGVHSQASDLTVSIYQCVLQCFLDEFPKLARFVHNQNSCHRILVCHICEEKDSDFEERPMRKKKLTKKRSKSSDNCYRDQCVSMKDQLLESQESVKKLTGQLEESQNQVKKMQDQLDALKLQIETMKLNCKCQRPIQPIKRDLGEWLKNRMEENRLKELRKKEEAERLEARNKDLQGPSTSKDP